MKEKDKRTTEIERKFLVREGWLPPTKGVRMRQGYVPTANKSSVRVRIAGERAFLTLKTPRQGISRREFEYEVPVQEAEDMLDLLCTTELSKMRHLVEHAGHTWEVDVFSGANAGLVMAEVELDAEDAEVELPPWIAAEVSHDLRYTNSELAKRQMPFA